MSNPFNFDECKMLNDPRCRMWPWIILKRDGNSICAHLNDFINLQESPAGFGATLKEAVVGLLKDLKYHCHSAMWTGYGAPAGTCDEPAFSNEIHLNALSMMLCRETTRCPKHGGFDIDAAAALAIYYRTDEANKLEALDWEVTK
jgi:hypothetical protein